MADVETTQSACQSCGAPIAVTGEALTREFSIRHASLDPAWFKTDDAREFMEWCFDQWDDHLTSAEQQRYDGWIGGFILAALFDRFELPSAVEYVDEMLRELRRLNDTGRV